MNEEIAKMLKQSSQALLNAHDAYLRYEVEVAKTGHVNEQYKTALKSEVETASDALDKIKKALANPVQG